MSSWKTRLDSQIRRTMCAKIVRAFVGDFEHHKSDLGKGTGVNYVTPSAVE